MAACGRNFTVVVTEPGHVWTWGRGRAGQLGLNAREHQLLPARAAGREVLSARMVMVAVGCEHSAGVTAEGTLLTWGSGAGGQLGHGDLENRLTPTPLGKELFGGRPAVMVACGSYHTLVLTAGGLWTCGAGQYGVLGHGDIADKLVLTLVVAEGFEGNVQLAMVAAGFLHSVAVGSKGDIWTWGIGVALGHNDFQNRHVPTLLVGAARGNAVMVAAGGAHTVAVTGNGELWAWGNNRNGQLGTTGFDRVKLVPARVGAEDVFGGSPVRTAACGEKHTLIVTKEGSLWSFGEGGYGALGHNNITDQRVPARLEAQHFGDVKIVSVAGGAYHSAAVTENGGLYTWGKATRQDASPTGLGHDDMRTKLVPTYVASHLLQGARVGRCHRLPLLHALAFAMGTHVRLGNAAPTNALAGGSRRSRRHEGKGPAAAADTSTGCAYVMLPGELVQRVLEACASWPEGQAGEMEGIVGLLGGMMKDKLSH